MERLCFRGAPQARSPSFYRAVFLQKVESGKGRMLHNFLFILFVMLLAAPEAQAQTSGPGPFLFLPVCVPYFFCVFRYRLYGKLELALQCPPFKLPSLLLSLCTMIIIVTVPMICSLVTDWLYPVRGTAYFMGYRRDATDLVFRAIFSSAMWAAAATIVYGYTLLVELTLVRLIYKFTPSLTRKLHEAITLVLSAAILGLMIKILFLR